MAERHRASLPALWVVRAGCGSEKPRSNATTRSIHLVHRMTGNQSSSWSAKSRTFDRGPGSSRRGCGEEEWSGDGALGKVGPSFGHLAGVYRMTGGESEEPSRLCGAAWSASCVVGLGRHNRSVCVVAQRRRFGGISFTTVHPRPRVGHLTFVYRMTGWRIKGTAWGCTIVGRSRRS